MDYNYQGKQNLVTEESLDSYDRVFISTASFAKGSCVDDEAVAYYQWRRDKELGRARYPEFPDYVVYESPDNDVLRTIHEPTGIIHTSKRRDVGENPALGEHESRAVARRHVYGESKPWEHSKPGEIWEIETKLYGTIVAQRIDEDGWDWSFVDEYGNSDRLSNLGVKDAKRIYPREDEA